MFRTFVDINGNIQYIPHTTYNTPLTNVYQPVYMNNPYFTEDDNSIPGYNLLPRPMMYSNTMSDVNNDPELRKKVVRYFYEKFISVWLPFTFIKLQRYLNNTNDEISFIRNIDDYEKKLVNDDRKIDFIIDNIFSKHELLVFLDKFVNKYNANWYDLKTKHAETIKSELYDKLKNHMKKIVLKKI